MAVLLQRLATEGAARHRRWLMTYDPAHPYRFGGRRLGKNRGLYQSDRSVLQGRSPPPAR